MDRAKWYDRRRYSDKEFRQSGFPDIMIDFIGNIDRNQGYQRMADIRCVRGRIM